MNTLRGILEDLGIKTPAPSGICPYQGLSYFDCNDEDYNYFYGRKALTQTLLNRVAESNFLVIVGASGSGKSSVLRAGLLQRLKDKGGYEIRILVPGEHPLQSLARAFVDEASDRLDRAGQQAKAEALIAGGADGLRRLVQNSDAKRVVLVVDQFEEAFTLCHDKIERQAFFEALLGGLEATSSQLYLILAMRSDFVGKCFEEDYKRLAAKVKNHLEPVQSMTAEELTQAIEEPARQAGVVLEPGLKEVLLKDLAQSPGGLPLLQYTLTELWKQRQDKQLRLSVYHQLGGVTGTLKQRADQVYESLTPEQQKTAKHIFLSLTQLGEGAEDTRRRITQDSLLSSQHPDAQVDEVVKRLTDANLIVTDDREQMSTGAHTATVDVAHEALIRNWPKLRQWLDESRDLLRHQRKIELAAKEWCQQYRTKQKGYLFQGRQLTDAQNFRRKYSADFPLSKQAETFINRSIKERWWSWSKISGILLLPIVVTYFILEPSTREKRIQNATAQIRQKGVGTREAIEYIVRGCSVQNKWGSSIPDWLLEPLFGDCISLARYDLSSADLSNADLRDANLKGADLSYTILHDADLRDASLSYYAFLRNAGLGRPQLHSTNLSFAYLSNADLSGANLHGANLSNADLSGANLHGANLHNAILSEANLTIADFSDASLQDADLSDAILSHADLSGADLSGADLIDTFLLETDFSNAKNLTESKLTKAELCRTTLPDDFALDPNRDCKAIGVNPETGENVSP